MIQFGAGDFQADVETGKTQGFGRAHRLVAQGGAQVLRQSFELRLGQGRQVVDIVGGEAR